MQRMSAAQPARFLPPVRSTSSAPAAQVASAIASAASSPRAGTAENAVRETVDGAAGDVIAEYSRVSGRPVRKLGDTVSRDPLAEGATTLGALEALLAPALPPGGDEDALIEDLDVRALPAKPRTLTDLPKPAVSGALLAARALQRREAVDEGRPTPGSRGQIKVKLRERPAVPRHDENPWD